MKDLEQLWLEDFYYHNKDKYANCIKLQEQMSFHLKRLNVNFREDSLAPEQLLLPPLLDLERSDSAETSFGSRIRRKKGNKARLSKRINRNQQQLSRVTDNDYWNKLTPNFFLFQFELGYASRREVSYLNVTRDFDQYSDPV